MYVLSGGSLNCGGNVVTKAGLIGVVVVGLTIASCSSINSTGSSSSASGLINNIIVDTQNLCGFLPTANSVVGLIGSGVPWLGTAEAVAQLICSAVSPNKPTGRALSRANRVYGYVNGKPIVGRFR
jgi:hypothetical protein